MKIGNVELKSNIILGPMAGVTDLPFRRICMAEGAGLSCMEMVSAKAIYYNNKNTISMLQIAEDEHPVSLQFFGSEPQIMASMAKKIADEGVPYDILDINMGCPMPKIVNNGEGSALMKNPILAGEIISEIVKAIDRPVTVKIRAGFDKDHINAVELAHIAEESGASAVAVHGRTREQYYEGKADWEVIASVKAKVKTIPIIGNGDVTCAGDAVKMIKETGCDGVMIARAARGNPWIFSQIARELETKMPQTKPGAREVADMMIKHAALEVEFKGEHVAMREMRKHGAWYTAGYPHSAPFRRLISTIETYDELVSIATQFEEGTII